jgi:hypothetical protein
MKFRARSLPHPVLNNGDDIPGFAFQAKFEPRGDKQKFYLSISFQQSHPQIQDLIKKKKAHYVVHVECGATLFRKRWSSYVEETVIDIRAEELRGRVEVNFFICAVAALPNIKIHGAHDDYGGSKFNIRKGDILAVAEGQIFDAEKDYDSLRKISAIMQILAGDKEDGPFELEFRKDKILIILSKNDFKIYNILRRNPKASSALTGAIVLPVLVEILHEIDEEEGDEFESYRWYRNLMRRLSTIPESVTDNLLKAQHILEMPLSRTLSNLKDMEESLSPGE